MSIFKVKQGDIVVWSGGLEQVVVPGREKFWSDVLEGKLNPYGKKLIKIKRVRYKTVWRNNGERK